MRCLSCQNEVANKDAKLILQIYLCSGCASMAEKAVKELERETTRALEIAKATLAEHIMKGGLLRTSMPLIAGDSEEPEVAGPPTKRLGIPK